MDCPSCHSEMPDESRFCDVCGTAVPSCCPSCGAVNRAGARYCAKCGQTLAATGGASASAERRQLTVMFCDLVGSTALSAKLDPEELSEVLNAYHRCCADAVSRAEGFVAQYSGDGVLAYFGYPQAHEHDAESAIRAALALTEAVQKLDIGQGAVLQARIGIATGVVVVGDLAGDGDARERGVVGETPNLAARLQALAKPGQVVIGHRTRCLAGGLFEYGDMGRIEVKGFVEPVQAWRVVGPRPVESRFEAHHESGFTPLVGREEELELLLRRWRQAASGTGCVVLLSGEPGIGKSRLTVALEDQIRSEPHTMLQYFCSPHHVDTAFYPVIAQLERAAGFEREDTPGAKLDKLVSLVGSSSDGDIPLLAELLSIPAAGGYTPLDVSPQRKKEKTYEALLRHLELLSRQRPVLMVDEDVHWIDPSSRELLDMAVEHVAHLPVLLLITLRPEFEAPWVGQAHVTTLYLTRLGQREGTALVGRVARNRLLSKKIMEEIVERADGVPLFVEELTKVVLETGADEADRKKIVSKAPLPTLAVPATLHASLMARLDRLGLLAKGVAQIGAIIGREFSYERLVLVAQKSDEQLQAALRGLNEAGLVFCRGTPPQATFLFKHALVRDAAYGSLLRGARRALHGRVVDVLEQAFPETVAAEPERLAQHCDNAGYAERAAAYWLRAGQRALARSAVREAVALLRKGLDSLATLSVNRERQSLEIDLQMALGRALMDAHSYTAPETSDAFARALALCLQTGDTERLFPILYGLWLVALQRSEFDRSREIAQDLLNRAHEHGDRLGVVMAHRCLGNSLWYVGDFAGGREHLEQARALYSVIEHRSSHLQYGYDPLVLVLVALTLVLDASGFPEQAAQRGQEALRHAQALGHPGTLAQALMAASRARWYPGDGRGALAHADALIALATEQGFPYFLAFGLARRGMALVMLGRAAEGLVVLQDGAARFRGLGDMMETNWLWGCARAHAELGQVEEGFGVIAKALELAERTGLRYLEPLLYRLRGQLQRRQKPSDPAAAEASFQRAVALARLQKAKGYELRAATSLARLWRDQGKRAEAGDLLAPIYGWFTEGFDTPDLKKAKALLEELNRSVRHPAQRLYS